MPEAAPEPSANAAVRRKRHTPARAEQITHELTAASSDFNVSLDRFNPSRDRLSDAGDQPNNVAARLDDIVGKMDPLLSLVTSPLALAHRVVRHAHALGEPHVRRGGPEPTFSKPSLDADEAREALRDLAHATRSIDDPTEIYSAVGRSRERFLIDVADVRSVAVALTDFAKMNPATPCPSSKMRPGSQGQGRR